MNKAASHYKKGTLTPSTGNRHDRELLRQGKIVEEALERIDAGLQIKYPGRERAIETWLLRLKRLFVTRKLDPLTTTLDEAEQALNSLAFPHSKREEKISFDLGNGGRIL